MEGCSHATALPDDDGILVFGAKNLNPGANALDLGRPDEDHFNRYVAEKTFADGAVDLTPVGVAANADVDGAESDLSGILDFLCEEDCAGASAEGGLAVHEFPQLLETSFTEEFEKRARLTTGDDEAVNPIKLFRFLYQHDFRSKFFQALAMRVEIALERQDTNGETRCRLLAIGSGQSESSASLTIFRPSDSSEWTA